MAAAITKVALELAESLRRALPSSRTGAAASASYLPTLAALAQCDGVTPAVKAAIVTAFTARKGGPRPAADLAADAAAATTPDLFTTAEGATVRTRLLQDILESAATLTTATAAQLSALLTFALAGVPQGQALRATSAIDAALAAQMAAGGGRDWQLADILHLARAHADVDLAAPGLFAAAEGVLAAQLRAPRLDAATTAGISMDLPELLWTLSTRLHTPLLLAAAMDAAVALPDDDATARATKLRTCLRLGVFAGNAAALTPGFVRTTASLATTVFCTGGGGAGSDRGAPRPITQRKLVAGGRMCLAQLRQLRDVADMLQLLAYSGELAANQAGAAALMEGVHGILGFLAQRPAWEALVQDGAHGDADSRAVVVAALKLQAVLFREVADGTVPRRPSLLAPWLADFIRFVAADGRVDREVMAAAAARAEDPSAPALVSVSSFERAMASGVARLCASRGLPAPVSSYPVRDLGVTVDLAWPDLRVCVEVDGPPHYVPGSVAHQAAWLRRSTTPPSEVVINDRRPNLGFLSTVEVGRTTLRRAALRAHGWLVAPLSAFDVWIPFEHTPHPRALRFADSPTALAAVAAALERSGVWKALAAGGATGSSRPSIE